jgi:hypothetical protein
MIGRTLLQTGMLLLATAFIAGAQEGLPPGVPSPIGPDGKYTSAIMFTTPAYRDEAFRLVLQEANRVAKELSLPEKLPIEPSDLRDVYVSPFGFAYVEKKIGNVETANFSYAVSIDNKLSYLERTHLEQQCKNYQRQYIWPVGRVDTNLPYQLATQWLAAASMDVKGLSHDLHLIVKPDDEYIRLPRGVFSPVYYVAWCKKWVPIPGVQFSQPSEWEPVALVRVFTPTRTLLQIRVEDGKYILREPLVITNLASLLSTTNSVAGPAGLGPTASSPSGLQPRKSLDTPSALAHQIARTDRIVCSNLINSEGEPRVSLTLSGERAKQVVRAISAAKRLQMGTNSSWDWELRFHAGNKSIATIRFQGKVFLAENGEFEDETGELQKLYKEALDLLSSKNAEAPR